MDVLVFLGTSTAYNYSVINVVFKWVKASQGSEIDGPAYFEISAPSTSRPFAAVSAIQQSLHHL